MDIRNWIMDIHIYRVYALCLSIGEDHKLISLLTTRNSWLKSLKSRVTSRGREWRARQPWLGDLTRDFL